jgi:hypothetical protein
MTTEIGSGRSADDINAVADPAWLSRVQSETGAQPFLDDNGAVVIRVTSGSGPLLEGAPPDRAIRLPALGVHQARVAITLGRSTLQRVIIDAHEQLEEFSLDGTGRIDDLTVNASQAPRPSHRRWSTATPSNSTPWPPPWPSPPATTGRPC